VWPGARALGCVLVHGFTATPDEVRPLGDALSAAGFPCHAVRLPGHATTIADLAGVRQRDWIATVETAVRCMAADGVRVAIAGVSLGALLALAVAESGTVPVDALALLGTPLRFADERAGWLRYAAWIPGVARPGRLVRKRRGRDILDEAARARSRAYDAMPLVAVVELLKLRASVRRGLHRVTQPTLVLHGRHDHTADVVGVEELRRRVPGRPLEIVLFEHSAHILTEDAERDAVAARVVEFFSRIDAARR
jgi:carboxylesterase